MTCLNNPKVDRWSKMLHHESRPSHIHHSPLTRTQPHPGKENWRMLSSLVSMVKTTERGGLIRVRCHTGRLSSGQSSCCNPFVLNLFILITTHLSKVLLSRSLLKQFFISETGGYFQVLIVFLLPQQERILNLNDLFQTNPLCFNSP